jgi:hypothetical protein
VCVYVRACERASVRACVRVCVPCSFSLSLSLSRALSLCVDLHQSGRPDHGRKNAWDADRKRRTNAYTHPRTRRTKKTKKQSPSPGSQSFLTHIPGLQNDAHCTLKEVYASSY